MSFLSGIKVFGKDIEKAFIWFGSPKGQVVVAAGEAAVEAIVPASAPIVGIFNAWAAKVYNVEALAVAAAQSKSAGADKAAAVLTSVAPDVLQYAQQEGLSPRTAAQIQAANSAVVAFINAMTQATQTTGVAPPPVPAVTGPGIGQAPASATNPTQVA